MGYLDKIRKSRYPLCGTMPTRGQLPATDSAVECYTAPFVKVGNASKATVSLCRSKNLVLDSCAFFNGERKGSLTKKFPLPARGAVKLACEMADVGRLAAQSSKLRWLDSIHSDVWWTNATRDTEAVSRACAPNSSTLVTTPTMFVMRDRHANYAHEMEVVSMVFSFLAMLRAEDVAMDGLQVVIVDQAPPTGFLETWARISANHSFRILADNPFPPGTCFRSAFHVYTFAAGIGYNTNPSTVQCNSPLLVGFSNWLRQLYDEPDPWSRTLATTSSAAAVAGPAAAAAGVRNLRPATNGIVLKNVVWLSRRNLEMLRMLLNASVGWKSMRMVRNEDEVVATILAAVQEWNAESCLLRRFERTVKAEYELSLTTINPVHAAGVVTVAAHEGADGDETGGDGGDGAGGGNATDLAGVVGRRELLSAAEQPSASSKSTASSSSSSSTSTSMGSAAPTGTKDSQRRQAQQGIEDDGGDENEDGDEGAGGVGGGGGAGMFAAGAGNGGVGAGAVRSGSTSYKIGNNIISLERLWALDAASGNDCRRTNVLFKFVDGDFNDLSYHQQLQTIFRTGVLVGVHGAGLAHGFFLPPGQSAVLQLLGKSYANVTATNVFRNMAASLGNYYEDVVYDDVDVDVAQLKLAVKRALDFVAREAMAAQVRRTGALRLVLVDQNHFSVVVPSAKQCPREDPSWQPRRA